MRKSSLMVSIMLLTVLAGPAAAVDLPKIDRAIARQPIYKGTPKYCLLVFGPEAKARVWLVLDGDTLYVDRNGNGDLTEEGERAAMTASAQWPGGREARAGDLLAPGGKPQCTDLKVVCTRDQRYFVRLKTRNKVAWTAWGDAGGALRFEDRPQDAPIVHFDGPLTIGLWKQPDFRQGTDSTLVAAIGIPGLGTGTFASFDEHEVFDIEMAGEIEFPNKDNPAEPIRVKFGLGRSG